MSTQSESNSVLPYEIHEIPQETLDKLILTPEAKEHYSNENELKKLIIERETYKRAYEAQQKKIDTFQKDWDNIMSTLVDKHRNVTFGNWIRREAFKFKVDQLMKQFELPKYDVSFMKFKDYKIEKDIYFIKDFAM